MAKKIHENIYQIKVPLPGNPLKYLNAYLITGKDRNLLIDTGFNHPRAMDALLTGFSDIGISPDDTDLLITHLHVDHSGLASKLRRENSRVFMSGSDGSLVNNMDKKSYWEEMERIFVKHGMPAMIDEVRSEMHPGRVFSAMKPFPFTTVSDGDIFEVGGYRLTALITSGHTPEHICLYEKEKKIFFSGDQILDEITPVISIEKGMDDPLTNYLDSLKRLLALDVRICFPGHRRIIRDFSVRIRELLMHHNVRLREVIEILKRDGGALNAYEIASKMTWRMTSKAWEETVRQQRWFATGEAMAHMIYLEKKNILEKVENKEEIRYRIRKDCTSENSSTD